MKKKYQPKPYSRKKCLKGTVSRRSYVKKNGTRVKAGCVKSKGLRSKGKKPIRGIPTLKKGTLSKHGYSVKSPREERHKSLRRSVKEHGKGVVIKKLNAVRVLSRNTNPKNSAIFTSDMKYVQSLK